MPRPPLVVPLLAAALAGGPLAAQGLGFGAGRDQDETDGSGLPGIEMLMEGSILQQVLIPQYDADKRLASTLEAGRLVLTDRQTIDAREVRISFFHPDRSPKARIELLQARLIDQKLLRSKQQVTLESGDLSASGTGLVYEIESARGFLLGPAEARAMIDTRTAMNTRRTFRPLAGFALMAAAGLHAQPPGTLSESQAEGLDRLAVSQRPAAESAAREAKASLATTDEESAAAGRTLERFLERAAIELPAGDTPDLTAKVPAPEEATAKEPATIQAKDGIYFDSQAGLLVFLREVDIDHPEFTLRGADEVKVFLEREEEAEPDDQPDQPDEEESAADDGELLAEADFGDPSKIVATGTVVVERKALEPGDRKAKASGRQMVYDLSSDELIIRGGEPWIQSDTANGYVVDPNGYIRINLKTGDASFVGDSRGFIETSRGD